MRISINLATRPFVELRPLFARLRLAMAALAVTAVALGIVLHSMAARARVSEAQMHDLKVRTSVLENERTANEARMKQPQNRAVLERSKFLNDLFVSKSFSWTSVMMDLERVLPAGVQVTSIEPSVTPDHDVSIHLRVSGDRDRAVDLIRNLEQSQRFLAPRLANETAQTQEPGKMTNVSQVGVPGGVEFDILSGYNPLPAIAKGTGEKDDAVKGGSVKKSAGDAAKPSSPAHKGAVHAGAKAAGATGTSGKPAAKRGAQ
jgi:type IV pilus assembly protein PilN